LILTLIKLKDLSGKLEKRCDKKTKKANYLKRELLKRSELDNNIILYTVFIRLREDFKVEF
jgi:hypothetical protein